MREMVVNNPSLSAQHGKWNAWVLESESLREESSAQAEWMSTKVLDDIYLRARWVKLRVPMSIHIEVYSKIDQNTPQAKN